MNKLLVICGPTATGKTKLAAMLAKKFNGELVSADSRQVFRGNDLETNKERPNVPIWLYDVADMGEEFSVSHWVTLAREAISDIQKRHKLPIIVGGSGLYIKALLDPFTSINIPPDKELRSKHLTVSELQQMVERGTMNNSDWNNPRRLIRKIEIEHFGKRNATGEKFNYLVIGLTAPLPFLYKHIDEHLAERLRLGMKKESVINEHAIARKQMTWFKKQKDIHWFDICAAAYTEKIGALVSAWYN